MADPNKKPITFQRVGIVGLFILLSTDFLVDCITEPIPPLGAIIIYGAIALVLLIAVQRVINWVRNLNSHPHQESQ